MNARMCKPRTAELRRNWPVSKVLSGTKYYPKETLGNSARLTRLTVACWSRATRDQRARRLVQSRCGSSIRRAAAAREAVSAVGHVDGSAILRRQSGADVRDGGCDEALGRFDERTGSLGDSQKSGIRRVHVHDRPSRRPRVGHQVEAVVGFEPQVRDEQVGCALPDVLPCSDEITAHCHVSNVRQRALEGPSASGVGFDDEDSSWHTCLTILQECSHGVIRGVM
jgi:hypothetical protein